MKTQTKLLKRYVQLLSAKNGRKNVLLRNLLEFLWVARKIKIHNNRATIDGREINTDNCVF